MRISSLVLSLSLAGFVAAVGVCIAEDAVEVIPVPASQQLFPAYNAVVLPSENVEPHLALPLGVGPAALGGKTLDIRAESYPFSDAVDAYLGIYAPAVDPKNIYLVNSGGAIQPLSQGWVPWQTGVAELAGSAFSGLPTAVLPTGEYLFYLLVTPSGAMQSLSDTNFYLWSSRLRVRLRAEDVANSAIGQFGEETAASMAVLLALDQGYSLEQIIDAILAGSLTTRGTIVVDGDALPPASAPYGLIQLEDSALRTEKGTGAATSASTAKIDLRELWNKLEGLKGGKLLFFIILSTSMGATYEQTLTMLLVIPVDTAIAQMLTLYSIAQDARQLFFTGPLPACNSETSSAATLAGEDATFTTGELCLATPEALKEPLFAETQNFAIPGVSTVYFSMGVQQLEDSDFRAEVNFKAPGAMSAENFRFRDEGETAGMYYKRTVEGSLGYRDGAPLIMRVTVSETTRVEDFPELDSSFSLTATDVPLLGQGGGRFTFQIDKYDTCAHIFALSMLNVYHSSWDINSELDYFCDRGSFVFLNFVRE